MAEARSDAPLVMPPHQIDGYPCRGAELPGYVHLLSDGRIHCNRCGWTCDNPMPAEQSTEKAQAQVAAIEAMAERWADVLVECKEADPRWILDRSVTTLETALSELRSALALRLPPADR